MVKNGVEIPTFRQKVAAYKQSVLLARKMAKGETFRGRTGGLAAKTYMRERIMHNTYMLFKQWLRLLGKQATAPFRQQGSVAIESRLSAVHLGPDGEVIKDHGIISTKLVTTAYVNFIVDNLIAETAEFGDAKFHDSGTGVTGENVADTTLETKVETGRVTGSQVEASPNIYRTVGTIAYTATRAITEHGIFTITAAGTLVDRSVFSAINVNNLDSIQFTYELTVPAGG